MVSNRTQTQVRLEFLCIIGLAIFQGLTAQIQFGDDIFHEAPEQDINNASDGVASTISRASTTFVFCVIFVMLILFFGIVYMTCKMHSGLKRVQGTRGQSFHSQQIRIVGAQRTTPNGQVRPLVYVDRGCPHHRHYVIEDPPPSYEQLFPGTK